MLITRPQPTLNLAITMPQPNGYLAGTRHQPCALNLVCNQALIPLITPGKFSLILFLCDVAFASPVPPQSINPDCTVAHGSTKGKPVLLNHTIMKPLWRILILRFQNHSSIFVCLISPPRFSLCLWRLSGLCLQVLSPFSGFSLHCRSYLNELHAGCGNWETTQLHHLFQPGWLLPTNVNIS